MVRLAYCCQLFLTKSEEEKEREKSIGARGALKALLWRVFFIERAGSGRESLSNGSVSTSIDFACHHFAGSYFFPFFFVLP